MSEEIMELTERESEALYGCISASGNAIETKLRALLERQIDASEPEISVAGAEEAIAALDLPVVSAEILYSGDVTGSEYFLVPSHTAAVLLDLLAGGYGDIPEEDPEFDELQLAAVGEFMNQLASASASAVAETAGAKITTKVAPTVSGSAAETLAGLDGNVLVVSADYDFGDEHTHRCVRVMSPELVGSLAKAASAATELPEETGEPDIFGEDPVPPIDSFFGGDLPPEPPQQVFEPLEGTVRTETVASGSMGLIYDIPLQVSVELGKAHRQISEILDFGIGTIVVLDKLAGDPVEIYVNGKLIAKGEVVVID
ncbi:MAG: FliM/FliN family flagellar motor switch protein, partial [Oscillospiraceae bacterium]|nr:FliM/FliN family flagellar motor switch protein [Oscillospiraceae bacterium]